MIRALYLTLTNALFGPASEAPPPSPKEPPNEGALRWTGQRQSRENAAAGVVNSVVVASLVWTTGSDGVLFSAPTGPITKTSLRLINDQASGILPPEALQFSATSVGAPVVINMSGPVAMGRVQFAALNVYVSCGLTTGIPTLTFSLAYTDYSGVARTVSWTVRQGDWNSTSLLIPSALVGGAAQPTGVRLESNTTTAVLTISTPPAGVTFTVMPTAAGSGGAGDLYALLAA